jgi:hypothetical protein
MQLESIFTIYLQSSKAYRLYICKYFCSHFQYSNGRRDIKKTHTSARVNLETCENKQVKKFFVIGIGSILPPLVYTAIMTTSLPSSIVFIPSDVKQLMVEKAYM